jgi:hypothetical protein
MLENENKSLSEKLRKEIEDRRKDGENWVD